MLYKDGKRAGALWWSDHVSNLTPIKSMYIGSTLVWDAGGDRPVVDIIASSGYDAQNQMRAAVAGYGLHYQTVEALPFDVSLTSSASVPNLYGMFDRWSELVVAPHITFVHDSTWGCQRMFSRNPNLEFVGDLHIPGRITNAQQMFDQTPKLMDGSVRVIVDSYSNAQNMITGSGLTRNPFYDINGNPI